MIASGIVRGSVLEVGSFNRQNLVDGNARATCVAAGLDWTGGDLEHGPGVDLLFDVLDRSSIVEYESKWDTVLLFNLLEHVYDPAEALRNSLRLVKTPGCCVIAGPAIWDLHDYPADYWRPLPDFYREFGRREGVSVREDRMRWIVSGQLLPVQTLAAGAQKLLPSKQTGDRLWGRRRSNWSRLVHRAANTTGRDLFFPYTGLGVVVEKGELAERS